MRLVDDASEGKNKMNETVQRWARTRTMMRDYIFRFSPHWNRKRNKNREKKN